MILILHVTLAITGIFAATIAYAKDSKHGLITSKLLAALTLLSGVILTLQSSASLLKVCSIGIIYFAFIILLNYRTSRNLSSN